MAVSKLHVFVAADCSQRSQKASSGSAALSASCRHTLTHFAQMHKKELSCVNVTLQNNKELFSAIETACQIFIAGSFLSVLTTFLFFFSYSVATAATAAMF